MSGNSSVEGMGQTRRNTFRVGAGALALATGGAGLAVGRGNPLDGLEEWLGQHVIGQERVIATIAGALRRWSAGGAEVAPRVASFLFLGPAHMGKTLLAKKLAERLFGSDDAFSRVDMRAAVGSDAWAAQLAAAIRARPRQLVLLDEVHAAPRETAAAVRRMLETGQVREGTGAPVDLRETVVIAATTAEPGAWSWLEVLQRAVGETVTFRRLSPAQLETVWSMAQRSR